MVDLNIHLFKVVFPSGKIAFESKSKDGRGSVSFSTVKAATSGVKSEIKNFLEKEEFSQASVDLTPFHDFEMPDGLTPRKCLPLTAEEKYEFWKEYNSTE